MNLRAVSLVFIFWFVHSGVHAQQPVYWHFRATDAGHCLVDVTAQATIEKGWMVYSQDTDTLRGPVPASLSLKSDKRYALTGSVRETGNPLTKYDDLFRTDLLRFQHNITLTQRVKMRRKSRAISGTVTYHTRNEQMMLPPAEVDFQVSIPSLKSCSLN